MGKHYHCDYCNKTFQDNLASRKRHLESVTHQRNRKAHYDALRDPSTILANEMAKRTPCRTYMIDGHCDYGETCRFSHLTERYKEELEMLILKSKKKRVGRVERHNLHDWLQRRENKNANPNPDNLAKMKPPEVAKPEIPVYQLPVELMVVPNLPISVLPPPPSSMIGKFEDWG